jgi:hypothetical protein
LDILEVGVWRDIILLAGAWQPVSLEWKGWGIWREEKRGRTDDGLGRDEELLACAEGVVEVRGAFAGEFEVLALVFAYWDVGCSCGFRNG